MSEGFLIIASQLAIIGTVILLGVLYTAIALVTALSKLLALSTSILRKGASQAHAYNTQLMANKPAAGLHNTKVIGA